MKLKVLNIVFSLFMAACVATSCLDDNVLEYDYSSNASITAFSIVDSIVTRDTVVINGLDSIISTAVLGSDYTFVIDQQNGLIYNPDSLPIGTDVRKVVVDITADTYGIYIEAETDSIWEEGDSLNFENPILFKVVAETGEYGRTYKAQINVHKQDPEIMSWSKIDNNISKDIKAQKAVYANNNIYVFADKASQVAVTMTNGTEGKEWSELTEIDIPTKADYASAMTCGNQLYILADNELYTSTNGLNWTKVETTESISQLLAGISTEKSRKFMAINTDNEYIESNDAIVWTRHETMPDGFPQKGISAVTYELDTNAEIHRTVLIGKDEATADTTLTVWSKLDSEKEWIDLTMEDNNHACPKLENNGLIHYNNQLYTFGGPGQYDGNVDAFSSFYSSADNGITWSAVPTQMSFPKEFATLYEEGQGNYSYIVDEEQFLWIIWSQTGEVWRGRLNKLGFNL